MTGIVQEVENEVAAGVKAVETEVAVLGKKVSDWWNGTAVPALMNDEKQIIALVKPMFGDFESAALQDLTQLAIGVLSTLESGVSLADAETAILNALAVAKSELIDIIKSQGQRVFHALISLLLAKLGK